MKQGSQLTEFSIFRHMLGQLPDPEVVQPARVPGRDLHAPVTYENLGTPRSVGRGNAQGGTMQTNFHASRYVCN